MIHQDPQLFWTIVAAIGQAVGAVATAAAVIVSLAIVRSERRVKLDVSCGIRIAFAGDGTPGEYLVAVTITNAGYRNVRISTIAWETGWLSWRFAPKWLARQQAIQRPGLGSPQPPIDLEPGARTIIFMSVNGFKAADVEDTNIDFFGRHPPWRAQPVATRIRCTVWPTVGEPTKVKAEPSLVAFLVTGEIPKFRD